MAPTQLPGFGRPLNYVPDKNDPDFINKRFPNALSKEDLGIAVRMVTLRESTMLQLMNVATDKEDWNIKLQNPEIAKKWKQEALSSGLDITPKMVKWCLDELRYKASLIPPDAPVPPIFVYNGDVFKSDNAVSVELKKALQENVKIFESKIPDKSRDWHPGSDQKVWDLVHPSLFPLVYGRTRVLSDGETTTLEDSIERCGQGTVTSIPSVEEAEELKVGYDNDAGDDRDRDEDGDDDDDGDGDDDNGGDSDGNGDVDVDGDDDGDGDDGDDDDDGADDDNDGDEDGDDGEGEDDGDGDEDDHDDDDGDSTDDDDGEDSVDNSPQYPFSTKFQWLPCEVDISGDQAKVTSYINNLHPQQEKPLYEIISQLITASIPLWELTLAPLVPGNRFVHSHRIPYKECKYDPDPERWPETKWPQQEPGEDEDDFHERQDEWFKETRVVVPPEPGAFKPLPSPPKFDLREMYGKRGLQVIVKLANIELTPDKPEYNGGTWHVEGQMNEHIVATALYYYSNDNITPSSLSFRRQVDEGNDVNYEQDHHDWLKDIFGLEQEGPSIQHVGGVDTREGRLLTFPNVLQHRVGSFQLEDPTKPGHRKIVALFLVDPNIKVISTAHVPCQRKDWWMEAIMDKQKPESVPAKGLSDFPLELQDLIFEQVDDFPISLEDAKDLRLELMKERKKFSIKHTKYIESLEVSLCEH